MTVARAVQDEVDAVRREMQGKLKAAQEYAETQVSVKATLSIQAKTWIGNIVYIVCYLGGICNK